MSTNKTKTPDHSSSIGQPHDKLLRRLLASVSTARDVLDAYLPDSVKAMVDLNCLERQPDTFVDAQHRKHEVDILFKSKCKNTEDEAYIWTLIEQQREPDVWLPLRIFCYLAVIWDNLRKKVNSHAKSVKIPFIYPLIISNASKPYHHSLTLRDMIEPNEAKPLFDDLFKTPVQLIDLAAIPDEELRVKLQEHISAQALLLSLKHVFDDNLQAVLETMLLSTFETLDKMGFKDDVADLLYYLYNEGNLTNSEKFWSFLHSKFSKEVEEKIMTLGQQAEKKAFQEGAQEGAQQEAKATALRMLEKNLDIKLISEVTHLSAEEIKRLAKKQAN